MRLTWLYDQKNILHDKRMEKSNFDTSKNIEKMVGNHHSRYMYVDQIVPRSVKPSLFWLQKEQVFMCLYALQLDSLYLIF